jgi:Amt family ammonium transporter
MYIISETPRSEFQVYKYLRVLPQEEVVGLDSLFADNDSQVDQLKRDYLKRLQERRSRRKRSKI